MATITESQVDQLRASLSPSASVVTPASDNYAQSIKRWSDGAEKRAAIVVYPTSAKDVSTAVLFSQANSLELAVVCGGHSTGGCSSTEGGLCIDLSKMRNVSVDSANMTITAQGGALWSDVDSVSGEHGLATVGGTVNHTGVGGLTLGGGIGWLSGTYGLVIDNLLEVEFVLADGSIVRVSKTKNPDLFWAIRGAGACFGVATTFVFKAYEQKNPVWAGLLAFPVTSLSKVIEFANHQVEDTSKGGKHGVILALGSLQGGQLAIMTAVFYNGPEDEGKEFFGPLLELNPMVNQVSMMPYSSVNGMLNRISGYGGRKVIKGSAFLYPLDMTLIQQTLDEFAAFVEKIPDAIQSVVLLEYFPTREILKTPPATMAYAHRGSYCNIAFGICWKDIANDDVCRSWARDAAAKFAAELQQQKKIRNVDQNTMDAVGQYGNYDGLGNTAEAVFGINTDRLVTLKKKYDPNNVFRKWIDLLAPAS